MKDLYHEVKGLKSLESTCRVLFGTSIQPKQILESNIPTRKSSYTTIFETTSGEVYALCIANTPLVFADISRIIKDIDTGPVKYLPPRNDAEYFHAYGRKIFQDLFPGRALNPNDDISFYTSLAPYNPALVRLTLKANLSKYLTNNVPLTTRKIQL